MRNMKRLLQLPTIVTVLLGMISLAGLIWVFQGGYETHPLAYAIYLLSFYTLCTVIFAVPDWIRICQRRRRQNADNATGLKIKKRTQGLIVGIVINLIYALMKLFSGFTNHSVWLAAVGGYYLMLCLLHGYLLLRLQTGRQISDRTQKEHRSWNSYRTCGWLILVLNLSMTGMVFLMIWENYTFSYPGIMIYASAAYTFYRLTMVIINTTKLKKSDEPIFAAAHSVDFCMAVVSIFTLQTAMFVSFGADLAPQTQHLMNSLTGGTVCFTVMCVAVFMICYPSRQLRELERNNL